MKQSVSEKMAQAVLAEPRRPGDKHGGLWEDPTDRGYAERVSQAAARVLIEDMKGTIALDKHAAQIVYRFIDAYAKENGVD